MANIKAFLENGCAGVTKMAHLFQPGKIGRDKNDCVH
jgi:hypothetical protein